MVLWHQHSPQLKRGATILVAPAFAGGAQVCEECLAQPPPKRRWHVSPTSPVAHRLYISITPYGPWNVTPDPMKGR